MPIIAIVTTHNPLLIFLDPCIAFPDSSSYFLSLTFELMEHRIRIILEKRLDWV